MLVGNTANIVSKISLTYLLLTPCIRVLLEKLTSSQLLKKFPHFMEPERSITPLQVPANCPCPKPDQSSPCPHPTSITSILILTPDLRLGLPGGLFSSGFPTKSLNKPLLSLIRATFPAHLILLEAKFPYPHKLGKKNQSAEMKGKKAKATPLKTRHYSFFLMTNSSNPWTQSRHINSNEYFRRSGFTFRMKKSLERDGSAITL